MHRRGHSSLNGVITTTSMPSGKILDAEPLRRASKACSLKKLLKNDNPFAYEQRKDSDSCNFKYRGTGK